LADEELAKVVPRPWAPERVPAPSKVSRPLTIAYVAPKWDYGDPARGLSFEETNFRSALEGMGHHLHPYDFVARHKEIGRSAMNAELDRFVREREPDLAFFFLFKDEIAVETVERLTAAGITTFNWFADDHWRFESFSRHYAPVFSLVSTTDRSAYEKYHAMGYRSVVLTQWAFNAHGYRPRPVELRYDVAFVGQRYGQRPRIVNALRSAGVDVRCWGHGWEAGRLSHEEMVDVFASSRVNLNLSNAWRAHFWRRQPPVSQIKARVFEVPGCGGFLLTDPAPALGQYLEIGREIDVYQDTTDLIERVRYWLENEAQRSAAARSARDRVLREHTYDHRLRDIFRAAGLAVD
jgi:spore maturation protein CgeB